MNKLITRNYVVFFYLLALTLVFLLVFNVQMKTPIQSDDYSYLSMGGSISKYYNHYISWSGRLSADVTSSSLLYFFGKTIYSAMNSLALTALIFLIAYLPKNISIKKIDLSDIVVFLILFLTYWVANTNLGQTTFWIVGSANYLWTNLYILIYINLLVFFARRLFNSVGVSCLSLLFIFCVGIIAGCSNENTGVFAFLFTIFTWLLIYWSKNRLRTSVFIVGATGSLLGWLILVCSPGNLVRSSHKAFHGWYSQSLAWRIDEHIYTRLPSMLQQYWLVLLVAMFVIMSVFFSNEEKKDRAVLLAKFAMFFFVSSMLAALMMVGAPGISPRTGNGTLVFLLIMLSFIFGIQSCYNGNTAKYVLLILTLSLVVYFIPSYKLILSAYNDTSYQERVRGMVIEDAKKNGEKNILIPDFYFSRLMKSTDAFDRYHNPGAMGGYWGVNSIKIFNVPFNYGVIAKKSNALDVNKDIGYGMVIHKIYIYKAPSKPFYKNQTRLIVEINKNPQELPRDVKVYIHLKGVGINSKADSFVKKHQFINADIGQSKGYMIGEKYYVERGISQDINVGDVDVVDAGTFK